MKYWEEFASKWGFGDGESVPPDAQACREVYVREINKLAAAKGSAVRLLAYDRPGVHNCYLILRVAAELVRDVPPDMLCKGQWEGGWSMADSDWKEVSADEAMDQAIQDAFEMELDEYVETDVRVRACA